MSIKDKLAEKSATIGTKPRPLIDADKNAGPKTAPGQLMAFRGVMAEKEAELTAKDAEISALQKSMQDDSGGIDLLISDLHTVPGRKRRLTPEQYSELKANLQNNPLITPISVRRRTEGGYEIVSGHNRASIYLELERDKIKGIILQTDDKQADVGAFFANLLQPNLPDYEKYLGYKKIQASHPALSIEDIADKSGITRQHVFKIMKFGELPQEALDIIEINPKELGATAAEDFAKLVKAGRSVQVIAAIKLIIEGKLNQDQGIKQASSEPAKEKQTDSAKTIVIKSGKFNYCDMRRAEKVIRLSFKSIEEADAVQEAIKKVLQERADITKSST